MGDLRAGDQALSGLYVGDQAVGRVMAGETEVWAPPVSAYKAVWEFNSSAMGWVKEPGRPVDWIDNGGNPGGHISTLIGPGLFTIGSFQINCNGWEWIAPPGTICALEWDALYDNRGSIGGFIPLYFNEDTEEEIVGVGNILINKDATWYPLKSDDDDCTFPLPTSGGNYTFGFLMMPSFQTTSGRGYVDNVRIVDVVTREPVEVVPVAGAVVSR